MQTDTRTAPQSPKLYMFSGLLRCADCGKSMGRRVSKNIVYYACKTNITLKLCSRHSIRHDKLERIVLESIRKQICLIDDISLLIDEIVKVPAVRTDSKRLTHSLKRRRTELDNITKLRTGLYLDWKNGDITHDEYLNMKREFTEKEEQLKHVIVCLEEENRTASQNITSNEPSIETFQKYNNIEVLNRGIVTELIKTIYIHEGGDVTIEFNFADINKQIIELILCCH